MMTACIRIGGVPLVHPQGHPRAGEVIEFPVPVPIAFSLTIQVRPYRVTFNVDVDAQGRARMVLVDRASRFPPTFTLEARMVPPPHPHAYRRLWDALLDEAEAVR